MTKNGSSLLDKARAAQATSEAAKSKPAELHIAPLRFGLGAKRTPARPWIVKDFAMRRHITNVVGTGGSNKTTLLLQLLFWFAMGLDFAGWRPMRHIKSLVISGEEYLDEMKRKLEVVVHHYLDTQKKKFTEKNVDEVMLAIEPLLHIVAPVNEKQEVVPCRPLIRMDKDGKVTTTEFYDWVVAKLVEGKYDIVYFDPLISLHEGFQDGETIPLMQALVTNLRAMGAVANCAVVDAHHTSQSGAADLMNQHASRGSTAMPDGVRVQINMAGMTEEMAKALSFNDPDARLDYVMLAVSKANYSRMSSHQFFRRTPYELATPTEDGGRDFGVVLVEQPHLQRKLKERDNIHEHPRFGAFLDEIDAAHASGQPYTAATTGSGKRAVELLVQSYGIKDVAAAKAALNGLVNEGILGIEEQRSDAGKRHVSVYRVVSRPVSAAQQERAREEI